MNNLVIQRTSDSQVFINKSIELLRKDENWQATIGRLMQFCNTNATEEEKELLCRLNILLNEKGFNVYEIVAIFCTDPSLAASVISYHLRSPRIVISNGAGSYEVSVYTILSDFAKKINSADQR